MWEMLLGTTTIFAQDQPLLVADSEVIAAKAGA